VLGVLSVLDRDETRPDADADLLLLQVFCEQAAIALETARSFRNVAEVLLAALARAASDGGGLATALASTASAPADEDLAEMALLLARLGRHDPDVRRLALDVLGNVLTFVEVRGPTRPGG
jgi:GAF domain-containing protein